MWSYKADLVSRHSSECDQGSSVRHYNLKQEQPANNVLKIKVQM